MVLDAQIRPGSFEYALDYFADNELDLSSLHERYSADAESCTRLYFGISVPRRSTGSTTRAPFSATGAA